MTRFSLCYLFTWASGADNKIKELENRIQELEAENRTLKEIGLTDPLTGVGNRRAFENELHHAISQFARTQYHNRHAQCSSHDFENDQHKGCFCIANFDLDNLKYINDNYGHQSGDLLITTFVNMLRKSLRDTDFIARTGGDEFYVIAHNTTKDDLEARLKDILDSDDFSITLLGRKIRIPASFGVMQSSPFQSEGHPSQQIMDKYAEEMRQKADERMYKMKRERKGQPDTPGAIEFAVNMQPRAA